MRKSGYLEAMYTETRGGSRLLRCTVSQTIKYETAGKNPVRRDVILRVLSVFLIEPQVCLLKCVFECASGESQSINESKYPWC